MAKGWGINNSWRPNLKNKKHKNSTCALQVGPQRTCKMEPLVKVFIPTFLRSGQHLGTLIFCKEQGLILKYSSKKKFLGCMSALGKLFFKVSQPYRILIFLYCKHLNIKRGFKQNFCKGRWFMTFMSNSSKQKQVGVWLSLSYFHRNFFSNKSEFFTSSGWRTSASCAMHHLIGVK